jgi:uridine kinase
MMDETIEITETEKQRDSVEVILPDGRIYTGPRGVAVEKFLRKLPEWRDHSPIIGAVVNGELRELTYSIEMDSRVRPVTTEDSDGALIYRRSITFLLQTAFEKLFPNAGLRVDHSVTSGGFYCQVMDRTPLTSDELSNLEAHMHELVEADLPLKRAKVPLEEAIEYFKKKGQNDKVRLMRYRIKNFLVLYQLGEHRDYHHGYMAPSTGYLKWFTLTPVGEGFVIQFPRRLTPGIIQQLPDAPKLLATFRQYGDWLAMLGIEDVGSLNSAIEAGRIREIILVSEALHEQKVAVLAKQIADRRGEIRIILIAGPSSSGKTTFSKRLTVQLLARGVSPFALEMDNYFVSRDETPRDENGEYDYESLSALKTRLLEEHLSRLVAGEEVELPYYDFKTGVSGPGEVVRLNEDQLIILEGIHGLNPQLLPGFPQDKTFRIYASCMTQLNLDRYNRISTTDSRLIRRTVRDARERGYSAQETIKRWASVRRGEKQHIFPYQDYADEQLNSALVYELSALKPLAEPLLRQVPFGSPEYIEAKRLLVLLEWFLPLDQELIPDNSIVREFIGGSILKDFKLWERTSSYLLD